MEVLAIYEIGFHFIPNLKERDVKKRAEKISSFITKEGGEIVDKQEPSLINLEYKIKHGKSSPYTYFTEAYFGDIKFKLKPESISKLEEFMKEDENVLRFLIFRTVIENTRVDAEILNGLDKPKRTNNNKVLEKN
ncbi:MAG: 30S ribosomal protein S6 [Candidatus Campbellbacteria bacterium]|nr:30S ribosomal protein S6 [Candidatus Campbellbacteria bacterium]